MLIYQNSAYLEKLFLMAQEGIMRPFFAALFIMAKKKLDKNAILFITRKID